MIRVNENYAKLQASYLFSEISKRVKTYQSEHPEKKVIRLGIGDVTEPLPPACIEAMHKAVDEMASRATFRGYGPEQGYDFLREAIAANDFAARGANVAADEIFVSDGAKCDTANIQELFADKLTIAIPDPVYPVYVDTNVMAGRTGKSSKGRYKGFVYLDCTQENGFVPDLPTQPVDLIYLCFPNSSRPGWTTPRRIRRSFSLMRPTKPLSAILNCPTASMKSKAHAMWPSSFVASRRRPASPVPAAPSRSFPSQLWAIRRRARLSRCMPCGIVATQPSLMVSPIRSSGRPRRSIHRPVRSRPRR
jgi:hypothetical protein